MATPAFDAEQLSSTSAVEAFEQKLLKQMNTVVGEEFSDARYKRFIVSHGRSSYWVGKLLGHAELKVYGFAAVSTYFPHQATNDMIATHLAKLNCFVLDIFAARSPLWVLRSASARKAKSAPRQTLYRQLVIENAAHDFRLLENELVARIEGWMRASILEGNEKNK